MSKLTTHVLNTASGLPAAGLKIDLYKVKGGKATKLTSARTNDDGRVDVPLLAGKDFAAGTYRIDFHAGNYLGETTDFLGMIPIQFIITDECRHYHVPLLLSPYGYSTYRGS